MIWYIMEVSDEQIVFIRGNSISHGCLDPWAG